MFGGVWSFVKRHRRKFVVAGVVVGGVVVLAKYAKKKLEEYQEKEAEECLAQIRRQQHFDRNQRTCNTTIVSLLPQLREFLCQALNTEALTSQLKTKPTNKLEIWDELKIMSFTRTIVAVYSNVILVMYLRVELNILAGYMYRDTQNAKNTMVRVQTVATGDIQQQYLAGVHYLFEQGLVDLVSHVQAAVSKVLGSVCLRDQISVATVQELVNRVRSQVEYRRENGYHDGAPSSLSQYMMPPDDNSNEACHMTRDEIVLSRMRSETRDMIDSCDFHSVMVVCLDACFTNLVTRVAEFYKSTPDNGVITTTTCGSMPLAKVIPIINGLVHAVVADSPNSFLQELLLHEQVKDFAANVYEAFCKSHDNTGCGIN